MANDSAQNHRDGPLERAHRLLRAFQCRRIRGGKLGAAILASCRMNAFLTCCAISTVQACHTDNFIPDAMSMFWCLYCLMLGWYCVGADAGEASSL